ncbi:hypothetical protein CFIMG_003394RAa [Ceratocystis fimbriata CBS 114723]|uniref:Uncharacterized protein n=1 Tax=Ceratocystis fimbriata CBS 114723 TaxID=1035309 RepID=A0A2C5X9T3_9PEZI|nr:hypothetical protein CFIMG_003394RAa [Ceratocystis fimbriata CBS 114723]
MSLSNLATHMGLDMMDIDIDMDPVDSMLFGNLPEMLAQDLELSSNVFVSKNMTAGHPQSSLSLEPRQSTDAALDDDTEDDAMTPPPIALPLTSSSLYEVMLRVKSLGSISEASSVQESIAMLRSMNSPDSLDDGCGAVSTFSPVHPPASGPAATHKDDDSISESVYSSHSSDFAMEPPIVRLSQPHGTSPTMNHYTLSSIISNTHTTINKPVSISSRWPVPGANSAISIVSQKSDPDTSWIDDSEDDENILTTSNHKQPNPPLPGPQNSQKSCPFTSHSHSLASPPATPPRTGSPSFHLPSEAYGSQAFRDYQPIPQAPISPPLRPCSSHRPLHQGAHLQRSESMRSSKYQPTHNDYIMASSRPSSRASFKPSRLRDSALISPQHTSPISAEYDDPRYYLHQQQQQASSPHNANPLDERLASPTPTSHPTDAMYLEDDEDGADYNTISTSCIEPSRPQKVAPINQIPDTIFSMHQIPSRLNTPDSWNPRGYTPEAPRVCSPSASVQAWIENPIESHAKPTEERRVGLPLPPDVADTLRVNIACFPDTMLLTSSLTIETIRSYSRKLKHGPMIDRSKTLPQVPATNSNRKWRFSRALGSRRSANASRSISIPSPVLTSAEALVSDQTPSPWVALRSVFPSASDHLCDALYAHVLAYNYVSNLCSRQAPSTLASPSHSIPSSAHSNVSSLVQDSGFSHSRQQSVSDSHNDIPKKAAHLLGLDAPFEIRSNSPVSSSNSRSHKKRTRIATHQAVVADISTLLMTSGSSNQGSEQAMRDLQMGLSRCIARLVVTMRCNVGTAGYADFAEDVVEVDPLLLRSLSEIVRCCEES